VQLRRSEIGEAGWFVDLAHEYYGRVPQRVIATLATQVQRSAERGLLRLQSLLGGAALGTLDDLMHAAATWAVTARKGDRWQNEH